VKRTTEVEGEGGKSERGCEGGVEVEKGEKKEG